MKLSDFIIDFFENKGVSFIFGYIGGAITHLVDSIDKNKNVTYIQTYHEQTAAIAAEGYARETNNFGVAIATSGPGATNLITGIADAYFDSVPVIFITGQVNTYEFKYDKPIRQQGFQEMDIIRIVKSITKYAKLLDKPDEIRVELEKAYYIATTGRPGPVLFDIPMNIQRADIDPYKLKKYENRGKSIPVNLYSKVIYQTIISAKRPLVLLGSGIKSLRKDIKVEFEKFLEETKIPVICSLMGKGSVDETRVNFVGMVGSYGNRSANICIEGSDLLIVLGSRLDTRQTGAKYEQFMGNGKIIHVDIDENELNYHRIDNKINLNINVDAFIGDYFLVEERLSVNRSWIKYIEELKNSYNQNREIERFVINKSPYRLIQKVNELALDDDLFVADIGQNQMWSAQTLLIRGGQDFFTSGGHAPMGFSLPFSIGLTVGNKSRRIFSISGDGGFHISIHGLMLVSQYELPIKIIVINNESLGMITQFQGLYFDQNMVGTTKKKGYLVPKIKEIAKAYSLDYYQLFESDLKNGKLMAEIFKGRKPCIIEYCTEGLTTVSPKLEYDSPIYDSSPKLDRKEMEKILFSTGD